VIKSYRSWIASAFTGKDHTRKTCGDAWLVIYRANIEKGSQNRMLKLTSLSWCSTKSALVNAFFYCCYRL